MAEADLSPELIRFIHATLPSYEAAVVLVYVSREAERSWTLEDLVSAIGPESIDAAAARAHVEHFVRLGILEALSSEQFRFRSQEEAAAVVAQLRLAYDERPVTLIRALDTAARAKIQSFADAFRLKRE